MNSFEIEVPLAGVNGADTARVRHRGLGRHPEQDKLASYLPGCQRIEIAGGGVPVVDHMPEEFAAAVLPFLTERR